MRCTISNLAPVRRRHWTVVTLPRAAAMKLPLECTFATEVGDRKMRAVRGRTVGNRTVYRVRAELDGNESIGGAIVASPHADAGAFAWHPWCSDDVAELVPYIGSEDDATSVLWSEIVPGSLALLDSSPAHQRWTLCQRIRAHGLHVQWWIDVHHADPVVHFRGKVIWSDRTDPRTVRLFQNLFLRCGEAFALDFAKRCGVGTPFPIGRDWAVRLTDEPLPLKDGSGLHLSGVILAHESVPTSLPTDQETIDRVQADLDNLVAAANGEVVAGCLEWDGNWLACGNTPKLRSMVDAMTASIGDSIAIERGMKTRVGWHGDRFYSLARLPGQAGSQDDFGATKGLYCTLGGVRHIPHLRYGAYTELLRGHNHYEDSGAKLIASSHPQWVTWGRETHWHPGVSVDRLGKTQPSPAAAWMHNGVDDEHMSANYLAAYATLSDDPLVDDQLMHILESDRAAYQIKFPSWVGATRAQGRSIGAWSQMAVVAEKYTAEGFSALIALRAQCTDQMASMNVAGPMRMPTFGQPDFRKEVYLNGQRARWASMWELGLFIVGLRQATLAGLGGDHAISALRKACETAAQFAFFLQDGIWRTVTDMLWNDGAPPPDGMVFPTQQVVSSPGIGQPGSRDVASWTFAGVLIARDVLGPSHPQWDRLNGYVKAMTQGLPALTREDAEWWAGVSWLR